MSDKPSWISESWTHWSTIATRTCLVGIKRPSFCSVLGRKYCSCIYWFFKLKLKQMCWQSLIMQTSQSIVETCGFGNYHLQNVGSSLADFLLSSCITWYSCWPAPHFCCFSLCFSCSHYFLSSVCFFEAFILPLLSVQTRSVMLALLLSPWMRSYNFSDHSLLMRSPQISSNTKAD